jgi:hypothetical protein
MRTGVVTRVLARAGNRVLRLDAALIVRDIPWPLVCQRVPALDAFSRQIAPILPINMAWRLLLCRDR